MRGVPGSGKSTKARQLVGTSGVIHSTDDYFVIDGEYRFDGSRLAENHERNFRAFCESLKLEIPVVICDNVNARRCHYERYVVAAREAGYEVVIYEMESLDARTAASRMVHRVPLATIERINRDWEHY